MVLPSRVRACRASAADSSHILKIFSTVFSTVFAPPVLPGKGVRTARAQPMAAAGAEQCLEVRGASSMFIQYVIAREKVHVQSQKSIVLWLGS